MSAIVRRSLNGIYAVAATLVIYVVAMGCFISFMFLLISMEEGGKGLSNAALPITQALVLLSQGSGFVAGAVTLTIMPLGLTSMLMSLLVTFVRKFGVGWPGMLSGAVLWLVVTFFMQDVPGLVLIDTTLVIELKSLAFYIISYLIACCDKKYFSSSRLLSWCDKLPLELKKTVSVALHMSLRVLQLYATLALATVLVWIILYHDGVGRLFAMVHMGTGSRVVTSFAALAWLPNMMIWALSWLSGAGFYIGNLASFTLWSGQSSELPAIPFFGLFPEPVSNSTMRGLLLLLPVIICAVLSVATLISHKGYFIIARLQKHGLRKIDRSLVVMFLYSFFGLLLSAFTILVGLAVCFFYSGGALGQLRLSKLGVNFAESMATFTRAVSVGVLSPWLVLLVVVAVIVCWNMSKSRIAANEPPVSDQDDK